jgi:hypothetical protein
MIVGADRRRSERRRGSPSATPPSQRRTATSAGRDVRPFAIRAKRTCRAEGPAQGSRSYSDGRDFGAVHGRLHATPPPTLAVELSAHKLGRDDPSRIHLQRPARHPTSVQWNGWV